MVFSYFLANASWFRVWRRKSIDSNQLQHFKHILDFYMVSWSLETYINRQNAAGGRVHVNDRIVFFYISFTSGTE